MAARRITIVDVAQRAGVGKVTVSYVLNGRSRQARISPDTERRVLLAAEELNYRPSAVGRMLASKRADALAVVFQQGDYFSTISSFMSEAMRGTCAACVENDFDLLLHTKPADRGASEADALMDGRVDGVLMLRDRDDPTLAQIAARGFPCVLFFTRSEFPNVPYVDSDNLSGGRLAVEHLLSLGHRRIGIVLGSRGSVASSDRAEGYRQALCEAGLEPDPRHAVVMPSPDSSADELVRLMRRPGAPTALVVWSDDVAFRCVRALTEIGLSIPRDVSIIGFDSSQACERSSPPLTSVRQPIFEMAREATRMLIHLVRGTDLAPSGLGPTHVVFPPTLDVRGSTAPAPDTKSIP